MRCVVVDTSTFVDYFRFGKGEIVPYLALNDAIVLSMVVRIELLKGARRSDRKALLRFCAGLRQCDDFPSVKTVEAVLFRLHGRGLNLGFADLLILADAIRHNCSLLTHDRALRTGAGVLKVPLIE